MVDNASGGSPRQHTGAGVAAFAALLLVPSFITAARFLLLPLRDPDFFWHLKTGEWIFEHRALPQQFVFAALPQDPPTAFQHFTLTSYWLSQLLLHVAYAAGGANAIIAVRTVLLLLLVLLVRRPDGDRLISIALLAIGGCIFAAFPQERPQFLSFLFAALLLRLLGRLCAVSTAGSLRRYAGAIPLLMVVWANCHGGYVVGLGFIGITVIVELLKRLHPSLAPLPPARLRILLGTGAAALLASSLNPNGWSVFRIAVIPDWARAFIVEYQSSVAIYQNNGDPAIVAYWVLLALSVFGLACCWKRPDPVGIALVAVTGLLSFTQSRFIPFFTIVALASAGRTLSAPSVLRWTRPVAAVAALGIGILFLSRFPGGLQGIVRSEDVHSDLFPVQAAAFVEREGLRGNIFNYYDWGGYLLWRLAPAKVFIDGRNTNRELFAAYQAILTGTTAAGERSRKSLFATAGVHYTITDFADPFTGEIRGLLDDLLADAEWAPVFVSPQAVVFARDSPENRDFLRRAAIPRAQFAAALYKYSAERAAQTPASALPHLTRGDVLVRTGDLEAALAAYQEALRLAPENRLARERVESLVQARSR